MAAIDYYTGDPSEFGNYQYVKLEDIINNYVMSRTTDDYTASIPRFQIVYQARRGMRELYYDIVREVRRIELELSPSLSVILPPDFVSYVRICWVDDNGHLHPLAVDSSLNLAAAYLQADNYEYLYDDEGCVLIGSGVRENTSDTMTVEELSRVGYGFSPNKDMSKVFKNGKFRMDKEAGVIEFGQDVRGKNIVLEYISDGLFTGCEGRPEKDVRIHKFAEEALMNFIYYALIRQMRNVPANEKQRAKKEFYNMRRITKRRINTLRQEDILQTFKGESQWIKQES